MCHGDDAGLRVPPRLAPTQVVVVLVKADGDAGTVAAAAGGRAQGPGRAGRARRPGRPQLRPPFGRLGAEGRARSASRSGRADVAEGVVTVVRRDVGTKQAAPLGSAAREASALLEAIQADMLAAATAERDARIQRGGDGRGGGRGLEPTVGRVMPWAALRAADGEARLREQGITVRCLVGRRRRPAGGRGRPRTTSPTSAGPTEPRHSCADRRTASGEPRPSPQGAGRTSQEFVAPSPGGLDSSVLSRLWRRRGRIPSTPFLSDRYKQRHEEVQADERVGPGPGPRRADLHGSRPRALRRRARRPGRCG